MKTGMELAIEDALAGLRLANANADLYDIGYFKGLLEGLMKASEIRLAEEAERKRFHKINRNYYE